MKDEQIPTARPTTQSTSRCLFVCFRLRSLEVVEVEEAVVRDRKIKLPRVQLAQGF